MIGKQPSGFFQPIDPTAITPFSQSTSVGLNDGGYNLQLSHLSQILQMKSQQVAQLEAEIRNLIKIQSEMAKELIQCFEEQCQMQQQLAVSRKNESAAKAIQGDDFVLTANMSRGGTAIDGRGNIDETTFLRCFITGDETSLNTAIKQAQQIKDQAQRGVFAQNLFHQIQRFLEIYHFFEVLCNEYAKSTFIATFEDRLRSLIECRRVVLWVRVKTANILVSPTTNTIVPIGQGILDRVVKTKDKVIIKDPAKDPNYNQQYDEQLLKFAKSVVLTPVYDSKKELLWVIEIVDRIDPQGTVIPPKPDDVLIIDYISFGLQRLYQGDSGFNEMIEKILTDTTKSLLIDRQVMLLLESIQLTTSRVIGCEVLQVFFADEKDNSLVQLREAARSKGSDDDSLSSVTRIKTPIDSAGIAGTCYKTKQIINIPIAKERVDFNMTMDGEYPNGSLLAMPLKSSNGTVMLVAVARQKRSGMMFNKTDEIMLEALSRVYSSALQNAQLHESNIQNIQKARTNHKYYTALLAVAQELSAELDTNALIRKVMTKAQSFINADRCSLFLVDKVRGGLWSVVAHGENSKIFVPLGEGIAGTVAKTGEIINIPDAYSDPRFNPAVDKKTGYLTKSILCVPIRNNDGSIMGCTQMINKLDGNEFTKTDIELMSAFNVFCGIALSNAQLYESATITKKKMSAILDIVLNMSSTSTLNQLVTNLMSNAKDLVESKYVFIFAIDRERHICHPIAVNDTISFSTNEDVVGFVATSGGEVNEEDPTQDRRFNTMFLSQMGIKPNSILAIPILDSLNQVIGVIEAVDKVGSPKFTADDQLLLKNFSAFAGLAMQRWMAKSPEDFWKPESQLVTILTATELKMTEMPGRLNIIEPLLSTVSSIEFDAVAFPKNEQFRILLFFFHDLGLLKEFNIQIETILRFITSISEQYHHVPFHNFNHAVDVTQMAYMIVKVGRLFSNFTKLEILALLVSAICHDMGHRGKMGTSSKVQTPLSLLFKDQPVMETFHCSSAIKTIGKPSCNILSSLNADQLHDFWVLVIDTILSTETSQHQKIIDDVKLSFAPDETLPLANTQQRARMMKLILRIGNLASCARPFDSTKSWSSVLSDEFTDDSENAGEKTPQEIARWNADHLKAIAAPAFELLSKAVPLLKGIGKQFKRNVEKWEEIANSGGQPAN